MMPFRQVTSVPKDELRGMGEGGRDYCLSLAALRVRVLRTSCQARSPLLCEDSR
jgi:hypothetical protein